jgi:choice-of-anchor A domain-containing protein
MFASDSTPCPDSDSNACTTAGCNGQGVCDQSHMVNPGSSNCANPIVGAATDCSVLELDGGSVSITGPSGVVGDICIGPGGKLTMTGGSFTTNVRLDASATFTQSGGGSRGTTFQPVDLSPEIGGANTAVTTAGGLNCDLNLGTISSNTTITATANPTVACVDNINLSGGKVVTLAGATGTSLIIRVTGAVNLSGSSKLIISANSGLQPKNVLYDLVGSGPAFTVTGGGQIDGTILAPHRDVKLSVVKVNGEVISAQNITIVSGAAVKCPPSPCVP